LSRLILIAAIAENGLIGKNGQLPWHIPQDLKLFKSMTINQTVIMGRKTFESIGKALPHRKNIVVSKTLSPATGVSVFTELEKALAAARQYEGKIFIIGGAAIFTAALPIADELAISHIFGAYEGDTFFPSIDWRQWLCAEEQKYEDFTFKRYIRNKDGE